MTKDLDQAIRERAYHLWVADGYQHGHATAHWLQAQHEVLAEAMSSMTPQATAPGPKRRRAKNKTTKRARQAA